jgi:hypothetical protein
MLMAGTIRWQPTLVGLALLLLGLSGCRCYYPIPNDPSTSTCKLCALKEAEATPEWALLPQQSKNHIYIYLLNGNDPLNNGNLLGVRDYLQARGFIKTTYGQQFHGLWFEGEIRDIAQGDPHAHFILVGFSAAAGPCNQLARRLGEDGIRVDRLIYVDGVFLFRSEELERPEKVDKFVSIYGEGPVVHGMAHEGADNVFVEGAWHFEMPTAAKTLRKLLAEATEVAGQVPSLVDVPAPLCDGPRPTPHVAVTVHELPPEWTFLKFDANGGGPTSTTSFKPHTPKP